MLLQTSLSEDYEEITVKSADLVFCFRKQEASWENLDCFF